MIHLHSMVVVMATTAILGVPTLTEAATLEQEWNELKPRPLIVTGDPDGSPSVTPNDLIDPNTPNSPYGGVGSLRLFSDQLGTSLCTGSAIHPLLILTAAHCLDSQDNQDGSIDYSAQNVTFNLNFDGDLSHTIPAESLAVHPDWLGFGQTLASDLALVTLSEALPETVPIYEIIRDPLLPIFGESEMTLVGYGQQGDGIQGHQTGTSSWTTKRVGYNLVDDPARLSQWSDQYEEMFLFDFDSPDGELTALDQWNQSNSRVITASVGNDREVGIAPGDSGGPSFLTIDDQLQLLGVTSVSIPFSSPAGSFGTVGGGVLLSPKDQLSWIETALSSLPSINDPPVNDPPVNDPPVNDPPVNDPQSVPEPGLLLGLSAIAGFSYLIKNKPQ
ncbi:trypsin-like serine protease [Spirulina sp. CS-785/01]|uniref:trypsin-like serine protease n=1 Tax=Spirulina sp. CS-785/01 TaxID=3021716 RepID=UPI00232F009A|nr:trypsin-like serine protease [Spirulina sp. CS-785/01]MDB9314745.1 trypsin-like serine protease [Spirulina sp. CS-785/01]